MPVKRALPIKIGIPCMAEFDWLPRTLETLEAQTLRDFEVWICVNQPANMDDAAALRRVEEDNRETLAWLAREKGRFGFPIRVQNAIDPETAPPPKVAGVGWARKNLFDGMVEDDAEDFLMVSLDADTTLDPNYLAAVNGAFDAHPNALALAAPYWHPLPSDRSQALRLLRYEIFLRYYQISLWRIGSPYAYLPLGSAMACRRNAYVRAKGMPQRHGGEDFYFLQKIRKMGPLIRWIDATVYPAARPSHRVPFGTGIMIQDSGLRLCQKRFPFYAQTHFDLLGQSFAQFGRLYRGPLRLACHEFLTAQWGGDAAFDRMRRNAKDEATFIRACHTRLDALRTLQFLRFCRQHATHRCSAEAELHHLLERLDHPVRELKFKIESIAALERLRRELFELESSFQKRYMNSWNHRAAW